MHAPAWPKGRREKRVRAAVSAACGCHGDEGEISEERRQTAAAPAGRRIGLRLSGVRLLGVLFERHDQIGLPLIQDSRIGHSVSRHIQVHKSW